MNPTEKELETASYLECDTDDLVDVVRDTVEALSSIRSAVDEVLGVSEESEGQTTCERVDVLVEEVKALRKKLEDARSVLAGLHNGWMPAAEQEKVRGVLK